MAYRDKDNRIVLVGYTVYDESGCDTDYDEPGDMINEEDLWLVLEDIANSQYTTEQKDFVEKIYNELQSRIITDTPYDAFKKLKEDLIPYDMTKKEFELFDKAIQSGIEKYDRKKLEEFTGLSGFKLIQLRNYYEQCKKRWGTDEEDDGVSVVTREDFLKYEECRESSVTNMFDIKTVSEITGLNKDQILAITDNYDSMKSRWMD